ncbi:MAG: long-chain fatty acid--CoA ligase [Deltaproteobacteria bacterium]|nr:long-chain fatty acid--CoA ligase [Deltaproteobacteria bacterium]
MLEPHKNKNAVESWKGRDEVALSGRTIAQAYIQRIEVAADHPVFFLKKEGIYTPFLWKEHFEKVLSVVHFYEELGVAAGDRACIVSQSRPEWNIVDIANLCLGVVTVPIYHSSSLDDTAYIIGHCEPKIIFVEDAIQLKKAEEVLKQLSRKIPLVVLADDPACPTTATRFSAFPPAPQSTATKLRQASSTVAPQTLATVVYTSGTTGTPKGVALTHANLVSEIIGVSDAVHIHPGDTTLTFLPFAHVLGRVESLIPTFTGVRLAFAESINSVPQNIVEIKPTILVSVPRIYEKINAKIQSEIANAPAAKKAIFNWSMDVGREVARLHADRKPVPFLLAAKHLVADRLVCEKIRSKLGGRLRFAISGGAPLAPELSEFFAGCGIQILEGYGLTETTAAITCNRPEDLCFGTVGKPIAGAFIRIAADGEIQMKGNVLFQEYYKNPVATKEAMTEDGWFCSGDIGEFNSRGFLKITDRKKELIVTSGGKNIAPQKLENILKSNHFVSSAMVYGDKEKYLVALICPNEPEIVKWAKGKNIAFSGIADLVTNAEVQALYDGVLKEANQGLASYETIKQFHLLPSDFTVETGELTPSLKIKRKIITNKHRPLIESMYGR